MSSMDVRKLLYGGALALVLALFIGYAQATFLPAPKYEDFCQQRQIQPLYNETICVNEGGQWNPNVCPLGGKECTPGYCNVEFTCQKNLTQANDIHGKKAFIALVISAILVFIIGLVLSKVAVVGYGVMGGGILTILYASIRYWTNIGEYWRLLVLGIALLVLIFAGYKKFKK